MVKIFIQLEFNSHFDEYNYYTYEKKIKRSTKHSSISVNRCDCYHHKFTLRHAFTIIYFILFLVECLKDNRLIQCSVTVRVRLRP